MALWTSVAQRLAQIRTADEGKPRRRVVVLGAGMAGLTAGYELAQLGHDVQLVEASSRVGGRVLTAHFPTGQYHELGAMRIPASHDYTRHYVTALQLGLRRFVNDRPGGRFDLRGRRFEVADYRAHLGAFGLQAPERADIERGGPGALYGAVLEGWMETLTDGDRRALFLGDVRSTALRAIDRLSLKEALVQGPRCGEPWSGEGMALLGTATALEGLWDRSLSMFVRDELAANGDGLEEICGGMDLLPKGLAARLDGKIRFATQVKRIAITTGGAVLLGIDGDDGPQTLTTDCVLCTLPFGVMRRMELVGFTSAKLDAIRNMSYASSTKVIAHCSERFWEREGILGGRSITDGVARQLYYPMDSVPRSQLSAAAANNAEGRPEGQRGLHHLSPPASGLAAAPAVAGPPREVGPGALLASYTWGHDARRLGGLGHARRVDAALTSLRGLHPGIEREVDEAQSMYWDDHPWAMGAFAELLPRDLLDYFPAATAPEPGLHFAGEHLSPFPGWIQGAIYSGLRATAEIVD
ncbi:MAG: NAD(P)/FAD-dependent oxidoreductase [Sandaracinaceae bacterium]